MRRKNYQFGETVSPGMGDGSQTDSRLYVRRSAKDRRTLDPELRHDESPSGSRRLGTAKGRGVFALECRSEAEQRQLLGEIFGILPANETSAPAAQSPAHAPGSTR